MQSVDITNGAKHAIPDLIRVPVVFVPVSGAPRRGGCPR